jgi:hypothetical protein
MRFSESTINELFEAAQPQPEPEPEPECTAYMSLGAWVSISRYLAGTHATTATKSCWATPTKVWVRATPTQICVSNPEK